MNAFAHASSAPAGPDLDGRRILAAVIDLALVILGGVVLVTLFGTLTGADDPLSSTPVRAVLVAWALYYFFALESGDGQTVGKKVMKLRVVRTDGSALTMREVAIRTVLRVIDVFAGLVVMIVTRERRQRLGDIAAGTLVADASAAPADVATNAAATAPTEPLVDADEPLPFEDSEPPTFAPPEAAGSHELEPAGAPAQAEAPYAEAPAPEAEAPAPYADAAAPAANAPAPAADLAPGREEDFDPFALTQPATPAEPAAEELAQEEPAPAAPAYDAPAYDEPAQGAPAPAPAYEAPAQVEPGQEEPAHEVPSYDEPAQEEPVSAAPTYDEPASEHPEPVEEPAFPEAQAQQPEPVEEPAFPEAEAQQPEPVEEPAFPEAQAQQPEAAEEPAAAAETSGPTPEESLAKLMGDEAPASEEGHEDEDVSVRSVETMSAIDMVMGGDDEQRDESPEGDDDHPSHDA
jgi:uncharacterized RDD family membrane protein YckC